MKSGVEANYKSTALKNVRRGQEVSFTADLYGGSFTLTTWNGSRFQPGSGNAFSLLPPENASGNWIKIVQKWIPVRISIDPQELIERPLFLGLSMRVTIDVHETEGYMMAQTPTFTPLYTTPIYSTQLEQIWSPSTLWSRMSLAIILTLLKKPIAKFLFIYYK